MAWKTRWREHPRWQTRSQLFGRYLADATQIHSVDPYVRKAFQVRNLEDLIDAVKLQRGSRVSLTTMYEQDDRHGISEEDASRERLDRLKVSDSRDRGSPSSTGSTKRCTIG